MPMWEQSCFLTFDSTRLDWTRLDLCDQGDRNQREWLCMSYRKNIILTHRPNDQIGLEDQDARNERGYVKKMTY